MASGLRSNLGAQLEALAAGTSHVRAYEDADLAMAARFDAARKAARIRRVLAVLAVAERDVLCGAYGGASMPRAVRVRFGDVLAGVAQVLAPSTLQALDAGELRADAGELAGLHGRAEVALRGAQSAYAVRRTVRGAAS